MKNIFSLIAVAFAVAACSTAQKDYDYMSNPDYQRKPKLTQSLINGSEPMSEATVEKILSSKVSLPKNINLAIVRLADSESGLDFQMIDKTLSEQFYNKATWGPRVQSVIPVPEVMLARPVTLTSLRQAAILLQADALVIIKPVSYSDWKYQWFEDNKAKGVTSLQVLFLDTRTSVVPFTSLITETSDILKEKSDYSDYELMSRAKKASEEKALLQVAPAVEKFITKVM